MEPELASKPPATLLIAPIGSPGASARMYEIKLELRACALNRKVAGSDIADQARTLLSSFVANDDLDACAVSPLTVLRKPAKDGSRATEVVGYESTVTCSSRPGDEDVNRLLGQLLAAGYRVSAKERRGCSEVGCGSEASVIWGRHEEIPSSWFAARICGKHNYKSCVGCQSLYSMTSASAAGQGPSVHCSVCGAVLVEWGSSKLWEAELISTGGVVQ